MSKIGPKEQQRRALRERPVKDRAHAVNAANRQKRPTQRVKPIPGVKPRHMAAEATPEVAKALRYYRQRLKTARVYQRGYYAKNRAKILQQRKERAEKQP